MSRSKISFKDEPSLGLALLVVEEISRTITELNKEGLTVMLVEQNAYLTLELASRAYVLETARIKREKCYVRELVNFCL